MLLTLLYTFLGLIVLCLVGRYVPIIGEGIILGCVLLASPFIWIEQVCTAWYGVCHARYTKTLHTIEDDKDTTVSLETAILSRILWLLFTVLLLLSDACNIIAAAPALLHLDTYLSFPDWLMALAALAFLIAPLVFGGMISELLGHPLGERFLPASVKPGVQWLFAIYALIGFVFSLCIICYFALFRAIYIDPVLRKSIDPTDLSNIAVLVFVGQVVVLIAALALCVHALIKGSMLIVFGMLPWVFALLCFLLSFLFSLFPRLLEIITVYVSGGARSPYDIVSGSVHSAGGNTSLLAPTLFSQELAMTPLPEPMEDTMIGTKQYASLVFGGAFGTAAHALCMQQLATLVPYARDVVLTHAHLDLDYEPKHTARPGDISPSPKDRHTIIARQGDRAYPALFEEIGRKQAALHTPYTGTPACFVYMLDCHILPFAEAMLRHAHGHLKNHQLIMCTSFSARDLRDETVVKNLHLLNTLYREGIIATTIVIDPASPFVLAGKHSRDTQLAFAIRAIIGLLTAHTFSTNDWTNKSSVRLIAELSRSFPLLSLSFASETVQANPPHGVDRLFSFLHKARTGDLAHIQQQASFLTSQVLASDTNDTRAFHEPINPVHDALLVCHTPLPLDKHFAAFAKEYQRGMEDSHAHFSVVTVSGNGTPYPERPHRDFLLQVSCLYPLGKVLPEEPISEAEQVIDTTPPLALPVSPEQSPQLVPVPTDTQDKQSTNGTTAAATKRGRPKKNNTTQDQEHKES